MSFAAAIMTATGLAGAPGRLPHVGPAVLVALASAGCYATSAVLQQQEASRHIVGGAGLVLRLARRPLWWLAVAATVAGALLHIVALALGPLTLVQPLGVLTLVFALPLGARLSGRVVTGNAWRAAGAVVVGLAALLLVIPHDLRPAQPPPLVVAALGAAVTALVLILLALATRLRGRAVPVTRAAAAASCFGCASAMARIAVTGTGAFLLTASLAVLGAAAGLGIAQLAYRDGGLGGPLATLTLVDPLVAVIIGVTLLGHPPGLTLGRVSVGLLALAVTAGGIWALSRPEPPGPGPGASLPEAHTRACGRRSVDAATTAAPNGNRHDDERRTDRVVR